MKKILMSLVVVCLSAIMLVSCKGEIKPPTAVDGTYVFTKDSFDATKAYLIKEGKATAAEVNAITYDMYLAMAAAEGVNLEKCSIEFRSDNTFKFITDKYGSQEVKYRLTEDFEVYDVYVDPDSEEYCEQRMGEFFDGNMNYFFFDYLGGLGWEKK